MSRRFSLASLLILLAVTLLPLSFQDPFRPAACSAREHSDGTGLIVSVTGEVAVRRSQGAEDATEGFVLLGGDTIVVRTGASCTGFIPSGETFQLTGPAQYILGEAGGDRVLDNVNAWIRRQLSQWIGGSRSQPLATRTLRDWALRSDAPQPLIPTAGGKVRPGESRFIWTAIPGVDRYRVIVAPAAGEEFMRIVRDNELTLSDLAPGAEYVWKVEPLIDPWPGESGWRDFRVMTPEEEAQLDEALKDLGDLEAGVLLLSAGLDEEALYRLDMATSSGVQERSARLWRSQALAKIGLHKQAYEDLLETIGQK